MTPLGDGYQQIQDPCAAVSNFLENYNDTELYQSWRIFQDPQTLGFKLHLFQFDGSPLAPQFQVSTTPNMLPTTLLRNVTPPATSTGAFTTQNLAAVGSAGRTIIRSEVAAWAVVLGTVVLSAVSLVM
jgi:hypothetical protein